MPVVVDTDAGSQFIDAVEASGRVLIEEDAGLPGRLNWTLFTTEVHG